MDSLSKGLASSGEFDPVAYMNRLEMPFTGQDKQNVITTCVRVATFEFDAEEVDGTLLFKPEKAQQIVAFLQQALAAYVYRYNEYLTTDAFNQFLNLLIRSQTKEQRERYEEETRDRETHAHAHAKMLLNNYWINQSFE